MAMAMAMEKAIAASSRGSKSPSIDPSPCSNSNPNLYPAISRVRPHRFFALLPEAKSVFGLNKGKMTDAEFYRSRRFLAHAKHFVGILDSAIDMLGPDLEMLTEIFLELGQTHRTRYKVKPEYFAVLGEALIETLRDILGPGVFDRHTTDCWSQVYGELSKDMIAGMARTVG
mmetsp:Transcript_19536/g.54502  ORF Transcript_19536/g.54502 Transcript_19536/m.54502 type:complete len:172 (-) Transcript_19536:320-835(-)